MESFLCDLVKPYVDKLINGAIAEARHVLCFTCIVKEFEEARGTLEPNRRTIEQRVKNARQGDKDILANVDFWKEEIDELNELDTKRKQTCFFGFCPDCIWRYKKGKELTNKVKRIRELKEKGERLEIENIELPRCLPDVDRYSSKDYISFKSREEKYQELLDALKDDNNYITGLQGMGGAGKTTLAKKVGNELKQSEKFAHVIDTTVSFTPDIKKIQDEIAGSLGLKLEEFNEADRSKKLWSRLTNGDKILVILDDVWDRAPPLDFDAIGIPKQDNHNGCRVLVTSRSKQTFNKMDCVKRIELDLLSKEDAWIMFKRYAGISDSSSKQLIDKGRKIAKECKQLPVAISVIASSLKGQQNREHEWDVTLKSLKQPVSFHGVDDDMVGIYNCLKISYDNLKDEKAKGLFLLCSVFREDEENSIEVLARLYIGVGLLGEGYGSYNDARNQVVVTKNKLVDSCLLLEVNEKRIKMHDLVRDVAQWIADKEIQCVKLFDKKQKSLVVNQKNIKYLLCEGKCMDFLNLKFHSSELEILIVNVDRDDDQQCIEFPDSFFENGNSLRVLYFSGNYHRQGQSLSLPDSVRLLINIRSMSFNDVDLGDISILGQLQSLETLDLVYCIIKELPDQITKLRKFKLLRLKRCEIRMNNPFEVIKRCSSLEELYFKDNYNDFCKEIALPELKRYHINNGISSFYLERGSRFPKYVVFCGDEKCQISEETLKYCMQTAEALCLEGIKGKWRNLMPKMVSVELGMNDLVELHLGEISQLRCLIDDTIDSHVLILSKLVVLELKNMENLEELFNGKINLCNLKTITVENCPMLVSILPFLSAQDLPVLKTIRITKCDGLKYVFGQSQLVELVSLSQLKLSELPNFIGIFEECANGSSSTSKAQIQLDPQDCSVVSESNSYGLNIWERLRIPSKILCNIKEIVLTHFPKMKSVFILSIDLIMQLEILKIMNCDELKHVIIDTGDHNISGNICVNVFPKLKELRVQYCPQLEYIFGHDTRYRQNHVEIQLHLPELRVLFLAGLPSLVAICSKQYRITFPSLKFLKLRNCSQDDSIIKELSGNVNHFLTLEILELCNCNVENIFSLNEIIDGQQLDLSLKVITLNDLPMMTCLFVGPKYSFSLKNLVRMEIWRCDKLKTAFSTSILRFLPQLGHLRIEECKELEHIIEDDLENKNNSNSLSSTTCFPNLKEICIRKCNKLKFVFSTSMLRFLPQLRYLTIEECKELEHIVEDDLENKQNSNSLSSTTCFPNLKVLRIRKCNKLKIAISTSILRFLPQLRYLRIEECKELEHIVEDDDGGLENKQNSNSLSLRTCFPKLEGLAVINCNKLKFVFPFFVCKELPKLKVLLIKEANELEEIFKSQDEQKVYIPNLQIVVFDTLPSLSDAQENQFEAVKTLSVRNCQQLTLTSASTTNTFREIWNLRSIDFELYEHVRELFQQLQSAETTEDFETPSVENVQDLTILPTNSKLEGSTSEKTAVATIQVVAPKQEGIEIEGTSKTNNDQDSLNDNAFMKVNSNAEEQFAKDDEIIVSKSKRSCPSITSPIESMFPSMPSKGDPSQKVEDLAILPTNSEVQMKQTPEAEHEFLENVSDSAILPTNLELEASSEKTPVAIVSTISGTKNEQPKQKGIEKGVSKTNNDQVSLNDDAFMKVNSIVEEQFPKDDEIIVSKSKPSPIASQFPSVSSKGDPSQRVEDLSSSLLVKRELEELISKNHLDYENLSWLTDFLVKNPSVRLKDTSLPNRYKGCAYNLLAELLKFLETHSLLEVSGSCHSEFVELLQDARYFSFDKEWLDGVERRALFQETQVSPNALEKLLDSKKRVTKDVEDLRFKIQILSQHVEDLKHQLISSEAVLESIIEQEAVLSAPIGY